MSQPRALPVVSLVLLLGACASEPTIPDPILTSIVVTPSADSLHTVGRTLQLTAAAFDQDGAPYPGATFAWTSSAPTVASVDPNGLVTAQGNGEALVTARAAGVTGSATVGVRQVVASLSMPAAAPDTLTALGATVRLAVVALDSASHPVPGAIAWSTTDPSVVSVDGGLVTAVGNGSAFVRMLAAPLADSVPVTVRQVTDPARSIVTVGLPEILPGDTVPVHFEARDARDNRLAFGGADVVFAAQGGTSAGAFLPVIDNGDGTYDAAYVAASPGSPVAVTVTVDGRPVTAAPPALQVVGFVRITADGFAQTSTSGTYSYGFTCGVLTTGAMYCWGIGWFGIRGNGTSATADPNPVPTLVSGGHQWVDVAAGGYFVCGITSAGRGYCWGDGDVGQIGNGASGNPPDVTLPTPILTDSVLTAVSIGQAASACALTVGNAALCWGDNPWGRLGNGTETLTAVPTLVSGNHAFAALSTSLGGTCGITTSGDAYCWGSVTALGLDGGPGPDTCSGTTCAKTPVMVAGGRSYAAVLGHDGNVVCAASTDGQTYCWGSGYIGNGTVGYVPGPVATTPGLSFTFLEGGDGYHCGLVADGSAYCWGRNEYGRLGNSTTDDATSPTAVVGGHRFTRLSLSQVHACGVATDGNAYCWGANDKGELGDRTLTHHLEPVRVRLFIP